MITKIADIFNGFGNKFKGITKEDLTAEIIQDIYNQLTRDAAIVCICPLCGHHSFICWGYYTRTLIVFSIVVKLRVKRLRCKECGKTHAIHMTSIIGYCRTSLESIIDILTSTNTNDIDGPFEESYIYKVKNNYKCKWKARLKAIKIENLNIDTNILCSHVLNTYNLQFMQIHYGNNYLYHSPT